MIIIILDNHTPHQISGILSRYLTEISLHVFIGKCNSTVRLELWKMICQNIENGGAIMIWNTTLTDCGYNYQMVGKNKKEIIDNFGIPMITKKVKTSKSEKIKNEV